MFHLVPFPTETWHDMPQVTDVDFELTVHRQSKEPRNLYDASGRESECFGKND